MEKILLAIGKQQLNINAIEFACYITRLTRSTLTGVFLNEEEPLILIPPEKERVYIKSENASTEINQTQTVTDQNVHYFLEACQKRNVRSAISIQGGMESSKGSAIEEIITESRFADLLIVDPETSFYKNAEGVPTHFVKEVLANAECPVIISPALFESIDEVVFCYDGGRSSVFAIKQFAYLFPQYAAKKVVVLEVGDEKAITKKEKIQSWMNDHFSNVDFKVLIGDVADELFTYFLNKKNTFVVMGAFGRSMLSNFFKKSSADLILRVIDLPLFIAHH